MWNTTELERLSQYRLVLGSSSPRRQEILEHNLGISKFQVLKSTFEEDLPKNVSALEYVTQTAEKKAQSVLQQVSSPAIVIVADTIVSCGGSIYEKPGNDAHQLEMLQNYRSEPVKVITAVHVYKAEEGSVSGHVSGTETTELVFDSTLTDDALHQYIRSAEGHGAAGGFKYQGRGSMLFSELRGDYFNVVGLPVALVKRLVSQAVQS